MKEKFQVTKSHIVGLSISVLVVFFLFTLGATPEQLLQMKKETMIGIAQALANSKTEWVPKIIVNGNGSNGSDPMQAVGLNMLMQTIDKMNNINW